MSSQAPGSFELAPYLFISVLAFGAISGEGFTTKATTGGLDVRKSGTRGVQRVTDPAGKRPLDRSHDQVTSVD